VKQSPGYRLPAVRGQACRSIFLERCTTNTPGAPIARYRYRHPRIPIQRPWSRSTPASVTCSRKRMSRYTSAGRTMPARRSLPVKLTSLSWKKGLAAARQELQAREYRASRIGDASGMQMPAEARKILEEEGAQALAKSHGAIMLSGKQANSMIKGILAFFIVLMLIGIVLALVQIFLK